MNKNISLTILLLFIFSATYAQAVTARCKVLESSGKKITIECNKQTAEFTKGTKVKIKTASKKKLEGC